MFIRGKWQQRGITLIEQIMFIVIVSVGVLALVSAMKPMIATSADPMLTKQQVAIAEALLNEILHQPFTWCDPEDPAASTATSYASCALPQNAGPEGTESRGAALKPYDNVADYAGYAINPVTDAAGNNTMAGYAASVAIVSAGTALGLADNDAALAVTVTVANNGNTFALTGYRFRYAPRI